MKPKVKVSLIKIVQIRHEYVDSADGKIKGWNKKYQQPNAAAQEWAAAKADEWQDKNFAHYSYLTDADHKKKVALYNKYWRRALPVFKRLLQSN